MIYVLAGALSFVLLAVADELLRRGRAAAKAAVFALSVLLLLVGIVGGALFGGRLEIPAALRLAGWILGGAALALVVLALVVEVPTLRLYFGPGGSTGLVTTGMYAMARHPGVLMLSILLVSLVLVTGSVTLAVATPVWIGMDVALVVRQERAYLLPVYGDEYRRYKGAVPMLIPTPSGVRRGLDTIRMTKERSL